MERHLETKCHFTSTGQDKYRKCCSAENCTVYRPNHGLLSWVAQVIRSQNVLTGIEANDITTPASIYRQMAEFDILTNQATYKATVEKFLPIIFQATKFQVLGL